MTHRTHIAPRGEDGKRCWRVLKGAVVHKAVTSLLLRAVQPGTFDVDKNLYGVSGQVTAPGVLAFDHIFAALRGG
jgi:hypothetical protein